MYLCICAFLNCVRIVERSFGNATIMQMATKNLKFRFVCGNNNNNNKMAMKIKSANLPSVADGRD